MNSDSSAQGLQEVSAGVDDLPSRVLIVGAGSYFLSGISYYTWRVALALMPTMRVSVILMRALVPRLAYPGRDRVGVELSPIKYPSEIKCYDGVNWWWGWTIIRACKLLWSEQPETLLMQWWTGAVAHSYLVLGAVAKARGCKVVIEFHEVQDVGEARMAAARKYGSAAMRLLLRVADGAVFHSEYDRTVVQERYGKINLPQGVIPHGPYDHHVGGDDEPVSPRPYGDDTVNILYFGVIRPFKGVEYLLRAYEALPDEVANRAWLTIVGETWEGWTLPNELIDSHPRRSQITFVNRYVDDQELKEFLLAADVVALPYLRSSASGPLHTAMSAGVRVVVSAVGGLVEAARDYEGATFVEPQDVSGLCRALATCIEAGRTAARGYADPHSWDDSARRYAEIFAKCHCGSDGGADGSVKRSKTVRGEQPSAWEIECT